ncbi:tetratricopeptide repeat protein [Phaeodactylibacter xiamenensis]|uniref:tetratricopeptide repeat protein n=1 Tax=Phaeodactylibacter xiamenensis TaxID=1524460 RepID=UPI0024A91EB2|nr:tetratricopeptide repeat protein [Phaeodactylibacter xiamenensis]
MSDQAKQDQTAYFGLINGLARFLSREHEHGYVFATADYQPLESEIKWKLAEILRNKGKKLTVLRLEKDPNRSIRTQIEDTIAERQPDALLVQGIDELMSRDISTGELLPEGATFVDELNYAREAMNKLSLPVVFWLSRRNLSLLANRAADLFAQRRRSVFFFTYQPELEADTPHLQSRFREDYRSSEDYKRLRLQVNLLESQLKEARQKGYSAHRIAREIALPLATKYSELDLHKQAAELLEAYDEAFDATNPQLLKQLAEIAYKAGEYLEAEKHARLGLKALATAEDSSLKAGFLITLGDVLRDNGQLEKAFRAYQQYYAMLGSLTAKGYDGKYEEGEVLQRLGDCYKALGGYKEAEASYKKMLKIFRELYADNPHNEGLKNGLAISYEKLGEIYKAKGQFDKALDFFLKDLKLTEELYADNPHNEGLKNGLAISYERLGDIYQAKGQFDKALDFFLKRSKLGEELYADNPHNANLENGLAISYYKLAELYLAKEDTVKAKVFYDKSITVWEKLYERTQWGQVGGYLETVRERVAALDGDGNT